ncbi:hypothetical protein Lal_00030587 [Lupinus albus]|nr:hypothetical protein Lal_00030587 [Lupinus albus]
MQLVGFSLKRAHSRSSEKIPPILKTQICPSRPGENLTALTDGKKLDIAALRMALIGNICLTFLFFPVARGSSVLPLFKLTSESTIKYHIWLGHIVMTLFTAHGICNIIFWAVTNQISQEKVVKWDKVGVSNVAGELSLIFGLFMWIATIPRIRRKFFEIFFYTHYLYTRSS